MFDVSFPEFVICAVIGLLVLGPKRLPKVAAEIGKWVGRARRTATQLRRQLEREIELSDLENPAPPPPQPTHNSGEVPPGPGTHADPPGTAARPPPGSAADASSPAATAEPTTSAPTAPTAPTAPNAPTAPTTDAASNDGEGATPDWGSRERYGTTDKPSS
jgi:sec-independent protein translocase protein TatB